MREVLQIGARNMQNFNLLNAAGASQQPVLLKRGPSATIEDLLMSAEYLLSQGNRRVMLCERGIRTFENATRNTTDINAIPVLQGADPPAHAARSQPQHRRSQLRRGHRPRRDRRRGGRADDRGAPQPRLSPVRRSAELNPGAVRPPGTVYQSGGTGSRPVCAVNVIR